MFKMTGVLMKAFRKKPVTLMYPDAPAKSFENTRGSIQIDIEKCTQCGTCADVCPAAAIETDKETGCWMIQRMQCVLCGLCVETCPEKCLSEVNAYIGASEEKITDVYEQEKA